MIFKHRYNLNLKYMSGSNEKGAITSRFILCIENFAMVCRALKSIYHLKIMSIHGIVLDFVQFPIYNNTI